MADELSPVIDNHREPTEIIEAMSQANNAMALKLGKAILQLKANKEQFRLYERLHREKGTEDGNTKAETNNTFATTNEELIAELTAPHV